MINNIGSLTLPPVFNENQFLKRNEEENKLKKQYMQDLTKIEPVDVAKHNSLTLLRDIFAANVTTNNQLKVYEQNDNVNITKDNIVNVTLIQIAKNTTNDWKHGTIKENLLKNLENKLDEIGNNYDNLHKDINQLSIDEQNLINDTFNQMKESLVNLKDSLLQANNQLKEKVSNNVHSTFSLNITTKDGDTINVNMSQDRKYTSNLNIELIDGKARFTVTNDIKDTSDVKIKVNGDLDEKEQKVFDSVVNGVNNILQEWKSDKTPDEWSGYIYAMKLDETQISSIYSSSSYKSDDNQMIISGGGQNPNQLDKKQDILNAEFDKIMKEYENSFKKLINDLMKIESIKTDPKEIIKDIGTSIMRSEEDDNITISNKILDNKTHRL